MTMAEAAAPDLFSEQELTCSICLDLFDEPVSTPCGHNFCQACIGGYWASSPVCTCPLCKRQFEERPRLSVNKVFALIADKYKVARYGAAGLSAPVRNGETASLTGAVTTGTDPGSTNPFVTASGEEVVWCDVCTGVKQPAVSSCLTCTAAYCAEHVKPHETTPFYAKHPLMDPQEALRGRTCTAHRRLLEVYCRTCQRCICAICVLEEHRTHKTVSVQTERLSKQKQVARTEQEVLNRIKEREIHVTQLKRKLDSVKTYADGERGEVEQLLDQVSSSLDRIRSQVVGGIENQLDAVMSKGEGLVTRLEEELSLLTDRRATLELQAISQDHIGFLQSYEEATAPLAEDQQNEMDDDEEFSLHFQLGEVKSALSEVKDKMDDIRMGEVRSRGSRGSFSSGDLMAAESMMSLRASSASLRKSQWSLRDLKRNKQVTGHKKARVYMEDVVLNPVTAYPFLILSEDRKQVKRGEKLQFYRNSQQRFDVWSCVIAKEGFSTGRHYWEVFVGESKDWKLGVVSESAQRKGLFDMSPPNGYYALWWSSSHLRALTAPPLTKVKSPLKLRQVGVFLDMDEGQVSFYNVKSGSEIYSFTGTSEFTERMFPLLGTADKEVPLVLMTTQHQLA
ncbi:E3 ubiquitin-protein ligase TRIM58-like [Acanthopagrus latus]|uniref:E3 ubiquitin-protein ligase TRIM58-like n=1 Tax=Acanthopagrus latus TaxID=8177 RepID=UPI00187CAD1F|nr:E3 ubiquitin-protein ligase TRIM58-like [Acanthopagrus latus]XP_036945951.1 E3 ubiquitin-protein ligase TRIM58-like [Acanthopagrus latus]XP_036945952.1 E3 ubiquitin-protein ligase TRIM58-like [Acanthopagrus latus]